MQSSTESLFSTKEHRGCNIRVASYEVRPQTWIPEACVSLNTDLGARKLWVRSFAHCFASEHVTFDNRTAADHWALSAAEAIIDKALPDFNSPASSCADPATEPVSPASRLPMRMIDRFRDLLRRS